MATSVDLNIITGRTGTAHVSSADDAAIWRGFVGNNNVTLFTDQRLALNHSTKGKLVVSDGVLCIGGRMGRISNTKTVDYSLPNSGYYRRTLLVARYAINNGIESMTLLTLQNDPANDATTPRAAENLGISTDESNDYILYDFVCDPDGVVSGTLKRNFNIMDTIPILRTAIDQLTDSITNETTARQSADNALGNRIDSEASTRSSQDNVLGTRITNEENARRGADTALGNRIDSEVTTRSTQDSALGTRITNETTARENADSNIRTLIGDKFKQITVGYGKGLAYTPLDDGIYFVPYDYGYTSRSVTYTEKDQDKTTIVSARGMPVFVIPYYRMIPYFWKYLYLPSGSLYSIEAGNTIEFYSGEYILGVVVARKYTIESIAGGYTYEQNNYTTVWKIQYLKKTDGTDVAVGGNQLTIYKLTI